MSTYWGRILILLYSRCCYKYLSPNWLVVSTHLKNISQIGNLPQIGGENKKSLKPPPSNSKVLRIISPFDKNKYCFFTPGAKKKIARIPTDGWTPRMFNLKRSHERPGPTKMHSPYRHDQPHIPPERFDGVWFLYVFVWGVQSYWKHSVFGCFLWMSGVAVGHAMPCFMQGSLCYPRVKANQHHLNPIVWTLYDCYVPKVSEVMKFELISLNFEPRPAPTSCQWSYNPQK